MFSSVAVVWRSGASQMTSGLLCEIKAISEENIWRGAKLNDGFMDTYMDTTYSYVFESVVFTENHSACNIAIY